MAKITFKAELRIPRQVVLPLSVAHAAQSPRTLMIDKRTLDADSAIIDHLAQRYPGWFEAKPKDDDAPGEKPLEKMTIAELTELAAAEGIDLGKAKLHADIVKVIADHEPSDEEDESESDDEADGEQDPDPEGGEADEGQAEDSDA